MGIKIIVAASKNMIIGKDGGLPWNLPTDLKYFKSVTDGHTVIMGRKCWDSIPIRFRPLSNRKNIIITRNKDFVADGAFVENDFEKAIINNENAFVIGGSEIYRMAFKYANELYLTKIFNNVDGDIYLNGFNSKEWALVNSSELICENGFEYVFEKYNKIV
jgi:dihydrofolate reductase